MTLKEKWNAVGGLSSPSKMPCYGYSLSASDCRVGTKLRALKGSTCASCYAMRGNYTFPGVKAAHANRMEAISKDNWVDLMVDLITHYEKSGYFRWHDSGDLQSVDHLRKIVEICRRTPDISHWLPTREYQIVRTFLKTNSFPENLTVRLSAHMVEGDAPAILHTVQSGVHRKNPTGHVCPARTQGNICGDCRVCWDKTVQLVSYHVH